jgi:branched-chain amino acid transport system ATP-binding protein
VAAKDLSVVVKSGERLGLIGNNGAGKTTFVNIVTGYVKPDTGRILLDGKDITGLAPRQVSQHGVSRSFQIPQLFLTMTPEENLLAALGIARSQRMSAWRPARSPELVEELEDLLARFRLCEYRDRSIAVLPGGVRKLVDIAMAVTRRPKLLLLDEPTSGVAAEEKFPLMDVVMAALEGGDVTVLFVEHDMEIVGRYADRVLAFYDGRIIADDVPEAVLRNAEVRRYVTGVAA